MDKRYPWNVILKRERLRRSWSQEELAEKISSNAKTISRWERGKTQMPGPYLRRQIAEAFNMSVEDLGLVLVHEEQEIEGRQADENIRTLSLPVSWGEAPRVENFLGRERELQTITNWINNEACHMIVILGLGGIGKTALATMAAKQLQDTFKMVYWRSLQQAPTPERFLNQYLQFVYPARKADLPKERDEQFSLFLASLREFSCLLILDNFESILSTSLGAGKYRQGYEDFGYLLQLIGKTDHASCLLLTSREKPGEVAHMEGKDAAVRVMYLGGMELPASQELLKTLELHGSPETLANLVSLYAGNPLALKLVAEPIRVLFGGDAASFLQEKEAVFGNISALLEEQFEPLGRPEKEVMYWLAIERKAVSVQELRAKVLKAEMTRPLLETIEALRRRSLTEPRDDGRLTLQPVVMEYITRKFVECIVEEVASERVALFDSHALMQAEAEDYVRLSQEQAVVKEIAERLVATFGKNELVEKLRRILATKEAVPERKNGYTAGNILNLLLHLQADLRGFDFSFQMVRQAYLQGVELIDVNFAHANLATSVFTETFSSILCVALSADGKLLAAGTTTGEVRLWQAVALTPLATYSGHADEVRSVAFSPDGRLLVSGSEDFTLRIWETSTGQCLHVLRGHTHQIYSVAFSPDGWTIASGSEDKTVRTWDATSGINLAILEGHSGKVRSLAFSSDGNILASGSEDTTVRLWDVSAASSIAVLHGHQAAVRAIAYSSHGDVLASGSHDTTIRLWDIPSMNCTKVLQGHTDFVRAIAFSSDGKLLASSSDDQTILLWDVEAGATIKALHPQSNRIWSLAIFPGSTILISASETAREDDTLCYWDIRQGECIRRLRGYCSLIKSVAFSPDGKGLVSGSEENEVRIWETASGRCLKVLRKHINRIRSVAFSTDGKTIASGSEDETICIWDLPTGLCRLVLRDHSHLIRSVAFNPDGTLLASASHDQTVRLWDVTTGRCLNVLHTPGVLVECVTFSPHGNLIASGANNNLIYLWDTSTGAMIKELHGHEHTVWSVAFSPDGSLLASASDDATLRIWDTHSGQCRQIMKGHDLWVRSVAFDPTGGLLVSGSHDHTVRIWNAHSGQSLKTLRGHSSSVWSVAFSPDGQTIASCGDDGTIRLWNTDSGALVNVLRSDRPYERMNISDTEGLTSAQKDSLITLGAFEEG